MNRGGAAPLAAGQTQTFTVTSGPTIFEALKEWRDARTAIFDTPLDMKVTPEQFARLASAEHVLMDLARRQDEA